MLKTAPNFVLGRPSPCDVPQRVRLSRRTSSGLATGKARVPARAGWACEKIAVLSILEAKEMDELDGITDWSMWTLSDKR